MNIHIDCPRYLRDSPAQLLSNPIVACIMPYDLNINWRRKTCVESLADNVRRLNKKCIIGILGDKLFANHFHIVPRWPMLLFIERYKDFAISGTDRGRVAQCKIEIHRQSNILQDDIYLLLRDQRPDHCIYLEKHAPRFFDACSGRSANVETKLPGVDQRKEIFSQDRGQENERENSARQHDGNHDAAMLKGPLQPRAINVPQFFKSVIKPFVKLDKPALWPSVNSLC